jgi:D-beta-D-heptose 7-phosphate kinase/D-beta-D-heptose 1-phosphate adenosyltransferase
MITPSHQLDLELQVYRQQGAKVVLATGCFDIIHLGHVRLLWQARKLGGLLVVGINSDASVRRIKRCGRPIFKQEDRAEVLDALYCVNFVTVFEEDTPAHLIQELKPDIFVKGDDYTHFDLPEALLLQEWGGKLEIVPTLLGYSTTDIARKLAMN